MNHYTLTLLAALTIVPALSLAKTTHHSRKPASPGTTIHVALTSTDANAPEGSASHAYPSLSKALEVAKSGDTILIHGGTYLNTRAMITTQATDDAPLTIKAAPGESVVLDGKGAAEREDDEQESKSLIPAILDIRNASHIVIEGLEVRNSGGYGVSTWESEYVTVRKCRIHHAWSRGLGGNGAHLVFEDNEIHDVVLQNEDEAVVKANAKGAHRYWSAAAATWYRADGSLTKDVIWRHNKIWRSWGEGLIALHADGVLIEHNEVFNTYSGLIYIDHSRNVRVDSNYVYHSTREFIRSDQLELSPGIMFASEVYKNTPIMLENLVIVNNVISNVQLGIGFWRDPDNTSPLNKYKNVVIANNVIHDSSLFPIKIAAIDPSGVADARNIIANNVIFSARHFLDSDGDTAMGIFVHNGELWRIDNNDFPNGTGGAFFKPFKSFAANGSYDPQLVDPRAVNPHGVNGFAPKDGSPVRAAGRALPEVKTDFDGKPRPRSSTSAGAFELD